MSAYLDWNATAPVRPEVVAIVGEALARCGNPSSIHRLGRLAREAREQARDHVAALAGAAPADIVFTSGGTEANQLALRGMKQRRLLVSAIEHDSVRAVEAATAIPVLPSGVVDLAALAALLRAETRPALVALMLANNETGIIQPVAEAARIAHEHGALLHCDAVQGAGRLPLDRATLGADLLTLSAHKIGGPQGIGALVVAPEVELQAQLTGGGQERGRRAGTENLPGIVGFGEAARLAAAELADVAAIAALRDGAERRLRDVGPAVIFGADAPRLANTSCVALPGVPAATQVMALDLAGVMVSAGAACSSGKLRPSHVLAAMGVAPALAQCAIRISLGRTTTVAEIDELVAAWAALAAKARAA